MTSCSGGVAERQLSSAAELQPELMPNEFYTFAIERDTTGYTLEASGNFARVGQKTLRFHRPFIVDNTPIWHYNSAADEYDGRFNASLVQRDAYGSTTWPNQWPAGSAYPDYFVIGDLYTNVYEGSASLRDIRLYVPAAMRESTLKVTAPVPLSPTNDEVIDRATPTLTSTTATARFVSGTFEHHFEVLEVASGGTTRLVETGTVAPTTARTSYTMRTALVNGRRYRWRVRAGLDGGVGPWSGWAPFRYGGGELFTAADGTRFRVEVVATGLEAPDGLSFAPDGRLFVTERPRPGPDRRERGAVTPAGADPVRRLRAGRGGGPWPDTGTPGSAANHYVYLVYTADLPGQRPPHPAGSVSGGREHAGRAGRPVRGCPRRQCARWGASPLRSRRQVVCDDGRRGRQVASPGPGRLQREDLASERGRHHAGG